MGWGTVMKTVGAREIGLGFVAAAAAVPVAHQLVVFVLTAAGLIGGRPWSLQPAGPFGVPALLNSMFWGGLWGIVFAFLADRLPGAALWAKGLVFGLVFPLVIGAWIVLPLARGQPFLAGLSAPRLLAGVLIHAAYGAALGTFYGWLTRRS